MGVGKRGFVGLHPAPPPQKWVKKSFFYRFGPGGSDEPNSARQPPPPDLVAPLSVYHKIHNMCTATPGMPRTSNKQTKTKIEHVIKLVKHAAFTYNTFAQYCNSRRSIARHNLILVFIDSVNAFSLLVRVLIVIGPM